MLTANTAQQGQARQEQKQTRTARQGQGTNTESVECENCGERNHYAKDCWSKKDQTNKDGSKGKNKHKNATDAHNPGPMNSEPEVELGEFDMNSFNVDAVEVRESEWLKIGVDFLDSHWGTCQVGQAIVR